MKPLLVYLLLVNALGFLLMLADKEKAKKNRWRIPEATLLAVAIIGGSLGSLAGMRLFRHKTKKTHFSVGLPVLFAIQAILLVLYLTIQQRASV